jgi:hypothetical protein
VLLGVVGIVVENWRCDVRNKRLGVSFINKSGCI